MKNTPTAMRLRVSAMSVHPTPLKSISNILAVIASLPANAVWVGDNLGENGNLIPADP
jgi:hypothetical protein